MQDFRDLISRAIEVAPSPATRQQLVEILEAAGGAAPTTNLEDSGGGGHTDPDG